MVSVRIKVPKSVYDQWHTKKGNPRKLPVPSKANTELMILIHDYMRFAQKYKYFPIFEPDYSKICWIESEGIKPENFWKDNNEKYILYHMP